MFELLGTIVFGILLFFVIKYYLKRLNPAKPVTINSNENYEVKAPTSEITTAKLPQKDLALLAEVQKHLDLAEDFRSLGFYEKAKEEYQEALALDSRNIEVLLALGDLNLEMVGTVDSERCLDEAIERYKEAAEVCQEDGRINYKIGVALERRGMFREALTAYQQAKEFGYQGDQLKIDFKRLERILRFSE
ncbi:MAG: tetratricopeptide repeat protein [Clostridia bacterium]|nr:tetratricopeptide repeat protein [Clostridia bacterium]